MEDTDKITDIFTFRRIQKFMTCSLCTPEGKDGEDVVSKDGWFHIPQDRLFPQLPEPLLKMYRKVQIVFPSSENCKSLIVMA